MTKFWLGKWNSRLGLAVMRQAPGEDSQMVAAIMLSEAASESAAKVLVQHLIDAMPTEAYFDRS